LEQWRRLEDDGRLLTESGGGPVGRVLTAEEQATASVRGVEAKHMRRKDSHDRIAKEGAFFADGPQETA
jgi:hypothetical protein